MFAKRNPLGTVKIESSGEDMFHSPSVLCYIGRGKHVSSRSVVRSFEVDVARN